MEPKNDYTKKQTPRKQAPNPLVVLEIDRLTMKSQVGQLRNT